MLNILDSIRNYFCRENPVKQITTMQEYKQRLEELTKQGLTSETIEVGEGFYIEKIHQANGRTVYAKVHNISYLMEQSRKNLKN
jgi:hypothetical protein